MNQVLYRKWRPQTLNDVIGQEHITKILRQAILQNKIANAYLFCGPRGTGKTSTARILAKAIICNESVAGEPCNKCRICVNVDQGRSLDLFEIDAASNRGIDDIRELRERVNFAPSESSHKVYIIDESHMLTDAANNAFLKTLEEPPPYVVFILATTESHKIPPTVASRCQRFDFHRIAQDHIIERLAKISDEEQITVESSALTSIARNASGSLRDAVNLLEQLSVASDANIKLGDVRNLFAIEDDSVALDFVRHCLAGGVREGLVTINQVSEKGLDINRFQRQVVDHLRNLLLIKSGVDGIVDQAPEVVVEIKEIANMVSLEYILKTLKIFEVAVQSLYGPKTLFMETALVESCLEVNHEFSNIVEGLKQTDISEAESFISKEGFKSSMEVDLPSIGDGETDLHGRESFERKENDNLVTNEYMDQVDQLSTNHINVSARKGEANKESDPVERSPDIFTKDVQELLESDWALIRSATKLLKPNKYNIGSLLLGTSNRYIENNTLFLVFKARANMERLQGEIDNPDTRRSIIDVIEESIGVRYDLSLIMNDQQEGSFNGISGHMVQTARSLGAIISEEKSEGKN